MPAKKSLRQTKGSKQLEMSLTSQQRANLEKAALEASKRLIYEQLAKGQIGKKEAIRQQKEAKRMQKAERRIERKMFQQALKQQMYPKKKNGSFKLGMLSRVGKC